ncbi:MAG: ABC transporter permease [Streptosporangiaceae bacterium]
MLNYLRLEILRTFRDRRFLFFSVFFPVMLFLLWSNVFTDGSLDKTTHLDAAKYMMVAFGVYGAIGAALSTTGPRLAAELQTGWLRQLQVTPLPAWTVITVKTLTALTVALPALVLVALTAALTKGVTLSPVEWVAAIGLLAVGTLPFAALGTLIGSSVKGDSAQPAMLMVYFPLAIVGGLWMPVHKLPGFMQTIAPWTPSNRLAEVGWDIVGGSAPSATAGLVLVAWTLALGGLATLAYRRATVQS